MRIYHLRLGQEYPWVELVRMARADVPHPTWIKDDSYCPRTPMMLAVPAGLWDLLHSGLGMRHDAITCRLCGEVDHAASYSTGERMRRDRVCCICAHWSEYAEKHANDDPQPLRIDGEAYHVEPENASSYGFRGYGGARFVILHHDGRRTETTNLWNDGVIPLHFRSQLPDNARFEREKRVFDPSRTRPRQRIADVATPWAVICPEHGQVFLTEPEYSWQFGRVDESWECPRCGSEAEWDDENHDAALESDGEDAWAAEDAP